MLVVMAALFAFASWAQPLHPAWGFVRAFAEAAMVGGLADWFAVTALFRHPLGLPIPHTAIIPRNKDRIGDSLAAFLRGNFLIPSVVARRMKRVDVAAAVGRLLARPPRAGRLGAGGSRLAVTLIESLDDERLGTMVKTAAAARLRRTNIAPLAGQLLSAALAEQRHRPVLDAAIDWTGRTLDANEALVRKLIHDRAGSILRWTGLDETISNKLLDGLFHLLDDMLHEPEHPLRLKAEEGLASLAHRLQTEPELQARIEQVKAQALASPAVAAWLDGLWRQAREALLRTARDPASVTAGKLGETLRQFGTTLERDPVIRLTVNRFARRAAVGVAASYGDSIVTLVSDTVRGWDARTVTARLENAVGRDLQYIRINGTIVGGLVGLLIHTVATLAS